MASFGSDRTGISNRLFNFFHAVGSVYTLWRSYSEMDLFGTCAYPDMTSIILLTLSYAAD